MGSFFIFGHAGCAGDVGHCDVPTEHRSFDLRPPHQLTRATRLVTVTESLRSLVQEHHEEVIVSVVPVAASLAFRPEGEIFDVERVSLMLYAWP